MPGQGKRPLGGGDPNGKGYVTGERQKMGDMGLERR